MHAGRLWKGLRIAGVVVAALVTVTIRTCTTLTQYEALPTISKACVGAVASKLLEESNGAALSRGFVERDYIRGLAVMPAGVRDRDLWEYCANRVVPVTLVHDSGTPTPLSIDGRSVPMQFSVEMTFPQVLAFVPSEEYGGESVYMTVCVLDTVSAPLGFSIINISRSQAQAKGDARTAWEFFKTAAQLWDSANEGQWDRFDDLCGTFRQTDRFECTLPDRKLSFSGEQLTLG